MVDPFDIGRFSVDPRHAWTLPAPYYYAKEVYEAEKSAIFAKSWRFVGHRTEIAKPGDYRKATQSVSFGGAQASAVILPVVP